MQARQIKLAMLITLAAGAWLAALTTSLTGKYTTLWAFSSALCLTLLALLYRQGWEPATVLSVFMVILLIGLTMTEPFVTQQGSMMTLLPPVLALVMLSPLWLVASALATLALLLVRAGGQGVYSDPLFLVLYALLVGGILLGRTVIDQNRRAAEQATDKAQVALARAEEQAAELARQRDELRTSEEHYRLITENASDLIAIVNLERNFVYLSPSFREVLGYDPAALLGRYAFENVHPDDSDGLLPQWEQVVTQREASATFRYRHADGSWRWFDAQATLTEWQGAPVAILLGRDVTERRRLEGQLAQSQKIESVGRLAGGIAHDFNNLLTAMGGYTDLVLDGLGPHDSARADLEQLNKTIQRAANLTRQLLAFARRQIIEPRLIDLNELVLDMQRLLERLIGEHIELVTHPAVELSLVKIDPGQIEQLIVNLAVNARDAMPEGGRLLIETDNVQLGEEYTAQHAGVTPGQYVLLALSDTGQGMSDEVKQHLFEPFFTTKPPGYGTGLGLATCYGIVKQNGGNIWIYSEVGQGTSVKIYLPQAERVAEEPVHAPALERPLQGSESVLVVEDNPLVRQLMLRVLTTQGYRVIEAASPLEALELVRRNDNGQIDLLLTDVVMPQLTGKQLAEQLVELLPALKVLYTSGYTDNSIVHQGRLDAGVAFLAKPFTPASLARKVRDVLDRA